MIDSPIHLAHNYWKQILQPHGWVIDATCGNGKDTAALAELEQYVISLDIQEVAIERARVYLHQRLSRDTFQNVHLFCQSHTSFPSLAYEHPIALVIYNLGYLPGGDKNNTTKTHTTLLSIVQSLLLIKPGGYITIACYPGHAEGKKEEDSINFFLKSLCCKTWAICSHFWLNRIASPSLIVIQKIEVKTK